MRSRIVRKLDRARKEYIDTLNDNHPILRHIFYGFFGLIAAALSAYLLYTMPYFYVDGAPQQTAFEILLAVIKKESALPDGASNSILTLVFLAFFFTLCTAFDSLKELFSRDDLIFRISPFMIIMPIILCFVAIVLTDFIGFKPINAEYGYSFSFVQYSSYALFLLHPLVVDIPLAIFRRKAIKGIM